MQSLPEGLYEQLITKLLLSRLEELSFQNFYIHQAPIDKTDAARILSHYLSSVIQAGLRLYTGDDSLEKQIELSNKIIQLIRDHLQDDDFTQDLIEAEGKILMAIFSKLDASFTDFKHHLKEITPYTRLTQSELFTGSNAGISLESEIKKEILSADTIYFLVSFIKWSGINILQQQLKSFTESGKHLRVITTSYMGASDQKAIEFLASLPNTEVRISYNTDNERLHAKAYLFLRNTGFHTGYIGSSNFSRSALTSGLEWNLKITTHEVSHIIDKFQKTFETYWQDNEFEPYVPGRDAEKLTKALKQQRNSDRSDPTTYFTISPLPYQSEILEKLQAERTLHHRFRNLVVAATGTGKTVISSFDYKQFCQQYPNAKLLFIAHRKEILQQALATFRGVLRNHNFGDLWVDGLEPSSYTHVFASVQTLINRLATLPLSAEYYNFIIIDEVHHITASSYRPVLAHFSPKILLGLTATPERMDGENILADFDHTIAAEIRLPEALNRKLLCPFQYFGITDTIDLSRAEWKNGKYVPSELTRLYTANDRRVGDILTHLDKYLRDPHDVRAIGFCVTQDHAQYMAEKFTLKGFKADYLVSSRNQLRDELRIKLKNKEINYLFVVDIFNEGVDIPEIDTVLFLRPTESLTVFLQQLGRGLRLAEGKECLTVLDFVGNARPEYDFENKFRALVGKTTTSIQKELEDDFPHLPLGCSIVLERKAKEYILNNIRQATQLNTKQLLLKLQNFRHQSNLPLTLRNFCEFYHIALPQLYKRGSWKRLCADAGIIPDFPTTHEVEITRAISKKWLSCQSTSYFEFILKLARAHFAVPLETLSEVERQMCVMLHYDVWQERGGFASLEESIQAIGHNPILTKEIIEVLEWKVDKVDFLEKELFLPYTQPLKIHSRYTREQILAGFGFSTFEKKSSNREGVALHKEKNTELLFVTLQKSEENFSPTTLYHDFAISETLFHWQSQNTTSPTSSKGQSYIKHKEQDRKILLFVRERNEDEYGNTMGYVFLGAGKLENHSGSKPMNITWQLQEPMPAYLWKDSAKMAVG
ncbi:DUF3427 domain-containing protein [Cytophagaceae bacterium DM2B3-1]|uniref:DUF3427 domain-containing protein n=1 Tax=Xanthocytophaga flava TaxID=3048013 RepID=A0ABT7CV74_9BACT|nr:DUF3427 domain-containing protein [Xanthocytophaga flavus]MDJ1496822.1 DUF3427 domain-containing protein [Xanthocytophaga flavus]